MASSSSRWSESWRVLAYSAAAALAFVALERLEFALFDLAGAERLLTLTRSKGADDRLAAEAHDIAARSRSAATLPSGHRLAAFRLGYEVGWASEFAGSFAMSDPSVQAKAAAIAAAHVAIAREQARGVGIDAADVTALSSRTLTDFVRLQERFEADESGLAGRVEAQLTPLHRHLFLLGAAVGSDAAKVQSSGGKLHGPQVEPIRRHATLAGVAPAAWQPLVVDLGKEPATVVLDRNRAAVEGVMAAIAAGEVEGRVSAPR
jgi:hypothetical protein